MSEQRLQGAPAAAPNLLKSHPSRKRFVRLAINGLMFLVMVVFLGFSNVFIMLLDSIGDTPPMRMDDLFADGGLFFFAMTLLGGSVYSLITLERQAFHIQSFGKVMYVVFIVLVIMSVALTTKNDDAYLSSIPHAFKPNGGMLVAEKIAAGLAVLFALVINLIVDDSANAEKEPHIQADGSYSLRDGLN